MPRGRQRGALPLAPGSVRFLAGRAARPESQPSSRAGSHVASDGQWRVDRGDVGPVGSYRPLIYVTPLASCAMTPVPTSPADTTVKFALDNTEYEIDLSNDNAAEMRKALSRYVDAARRVTGGGRRSAPAAKPTYSGYDPAAVRAWAAGQGIEVSARGRIKADVVERFRAAGN